MQVKGVDTRSLESKLSRFYTLILWICCTIEAQLFRSGTQPRRRDLDTFADIPCPYIDHYFELVDTYDCEAGDGKKLWKNTRGQTL